MWGVGPLLSFPTATVEPLTTGSWALGPAGVLVFTTGPWVIGGLATHAWTFADFGDDRETNRTLIQPFANFNLGNGWALVSTPIITADWDLDGDKWTVPLGGGASWTTLIGSQHVTLGVHYYYNVARPDVGTTSELRFVISFLYPKDASSKPRVAVTQPAPAPAAAGR
jgi:hypothetical protein